MPKGTPYIQPSQRDDYETPHDLFDALWTECGGFDLDPCCTPDQYTAKRVLENEGVIYVPPGTYPDDESNDEQIRIDGLAGPWTGKTFLNPPYGMKPRMWVPKAVHEVECGNVASVWALLPARTDVRWWQEYVMRAAYLNRLDDGSHRATYIGGTKAKAADIRFIKGRLQFVGAPAPATFPSAIVVWRR
jgi:site-specific DNA-methyltransferase (adenine-specific)